MTLKELADKIEALDEDVFVSLLQLEYTHDDEPGQVKMMMIDPLCFAEAHGIKTARPSLDPGLAQLIVRERAAAKIGPDG